MNGYYPEPIRISGPVTIKASVYCGSHLLGEQVESFRFVIQLYALYSCPRNLSKDKYDYLNPFPEIPSVHMHSHEPQSLKYLTRAYLANQALSTAYST